jgi:hypothetical protein
MMGEEVPLRRRVLKTIAVAALNVVLWIFVPTIIASYLSQSLTGIPLVNLQFIYAFGLTITILQALGTLTEGKAVSVPFISGSYIASAIYIWEAVEGGVISVSTPQGAVTLSFTPLLFLFLLPSLFSAVKAPLTFLLEQSEVAREAPEVP